MSDSQQLFELILHNAKRCHDVPEAVRRTAGSLKEYSALNSTLFGNDLVYVLNMCGGQGERTPRYYTMSYLHAEDYTVVSSERLPGLNHEWQEMRSRTLMILSLPDRRLDICDI